MRTGMQVSLASFVVMWLVVLFVAIEWQGAQEAQLGNEEIHRHVAPALQHLDQMRFGVIRIVSSTSELIVIHMTETGAPSAAIEAELDFIEQGRRAFLAALKALKGLYVHEHAGPAIPLDFRVPQLETAFEHFLAEADRIIALLEQDAEPGDLAKAKGALEAAEVVALKLISDRTAAARSVLEARRHEMAAAITHLRQDILGLGTAMVAILLVYSMFIARLLRREARARESAEHLAAENEQEIQRRGALEARLAAHQKMEALGTMLGGIAHSVNNYMTPIIALAHILKTDAPQDSEQRQDLEYILNSAQSASILLKDVLEFSRGRGEQAHSTCELMTCLRRLLPIARAAMPSSIEVSEKIDLSETWVNVREADIETLLLNLVGNAIDAIDGEGGRITLEATRIRIDGPSVNGQEVRLRPGHYVSVAVTDTGAGIPEEAQPHIFEPFFTTKPVGEGSGLGLAIAYGIVTRADGDILVTSEPGKGARFDLYLPIQPPPPGA